MFVFIEVQLALIFDRIHILVHASSTVHAATPASPSLACVEIGFIIVDRAARNLSLCFLSPGVHALQSISLFPLLRVLLERFCVRRRNRLPIIIPIITHLRKKTELAQIELGWKLHKFVPLRHERIQPSTTNTVKRRTQKTSAVNAGARTGEVFRSAHT